MTNLHCYIIKVLKRQSGTAKLYNRHFHMFKLVEVLGFFKPQTNTAKLYNLHCHNVELLNRPAKLEQLPSGWQFFRFRDKAQVRASRDCPCRHRLRRGEEPHRGQAEQDKGLSYCYRDHSLCIERALVR